MEYTKTLFIGDSIVKGIAPDNGRYKVLDDSYYNKFTEAVFSPTENKGRFGLTSEKFLKNIEKLKNSDADVIFFSIGVTTVTLTGKQYRKILKVRIFPQSPNLILREISLQYTAFSTKPEEILSQ